MTPRWLPLLKELFDKPSITREAVLFPVLAGIVGVAITKLTDNRGLVFVTLCGLGFGALVFLIMLIYRSRAVPDKRRVVINSLLGKTPLRKASGQMIMTAINNEALKMLVAGAPACASNVPTPWMDASFREFATAAASFVDPLCTEDAVGSRPSESDTALAVLDRWMHESVPVLYGEIRGEAGVGKSMLLHHFFVEQSKESGIVPMLASGENIDYNTTAFKELAAGSDQLSTFVSVWLKRRGIVARNAVELEAMEGAIDTALRSGKIILLLDAVDELEDKELARFVDGLLKRVPRWIVTRRHKGLSETPVTRGLSLNPAWTREQIVECARRGLTSRFRDRPEVVSRVVAVLENTVPTEPAAAAEHWLSQPEYLRAYIDDVAPPPPGIVANEADMYHRAQSTTGLISPMIDRAIKADLREAPVDLRDATRDEVLQALSAVAVVDDGSRTRPEDFFDDKTRDGRIASSMKALIERNPIRGLTFRLVAVREYFLATRVKQELLAGPSQWKNAEALGRVAGSIWPSFRVGLVDEMLHAPDVALHHGSALTMWLQSPHPFGDNPSTELVAHGKRNLLELWLRSRSRISDGGDSGVLCNMDLSGIEGSGLDLSNRRIEGCSFVAANLHDADLTHARFCGCKFAKADLTRANAVGAAFKDCDLGDGDDLPNADGMEIDSVDAPPETIAKFRNANSSRSRYRGGFGERFLGIQHAFLGKAVDRLEREAYTPAICHAIAQATDAHPGEPVFLIDLMAGGNAERTDRLLDEYPDLHVLSIDRDDPPKALKPRHAWRRVEFGPMTRLSVNDADAFGLGELLRDAFDRSSGQADVVIAKKALHELEHGLQRVLIGSCAAALRIGGHMVLFVDAPGPESGRVNNDGKESAVTSHERLRTLLLNPATGPREIREFPTQSRYVGDAVGQWLFVNDWISIKDWANGNTHELSHRYFASIAEICAWAAPEFGAPISVKTDRYEINPLRFNERGVNWVLHYLERNNYSEAAITRDFAMLSAKLRGSPAFHALVDFTRAAFDKSPALKSAMKAYDCPIQLGNVDLVLKKFESPEQAPEFELKCGVVVFERSKSNLNAT